MPFYEEAPPESTTKRPVRIPPPGDSGWRTQFQLGILADVGAFNPMETYKDDFRCIAADLRNANLGQSSGPLETDRPWDAHSDDQLGLMDHLGIKEFLVMGFCIGRADDPQPAEAGPGAHCGGGDDATQRVQAEMPDVFYKNNITGWGPPFARSVLNSRWISSMIS